MKNEIEVGEVQVERLDDIPVIFGHLQKIHIQAIIDQVIDPHGNWQGLSPGWVITIWLTPYFCAKIRGYQIHPCTLTTET